MPAIAAAIITALGWAMRYLVARVLIALGIQFATVVGLDFTLDWILDQVYASMNLFSPQLYALVKILRVPDAISILAAATMTRYSLVYGIGKLIMVNK